MSVELKKVLRIVMPICIFVLFGSFIMFAKPSTLHIFETILFSLGGLLFVVIWVFGIMSKVAPERAAKFGIKAGPGWGFVGSEGAGQLRIVDSVGGPLRVEWSTQSYLFTMAVGIALGPVATAFAVSKYLTAPATFATVTGPLRFILPCFMLMLCFFGILGVYRYVFRRPAVVVYEKTLMLVAGRTVVKGFQCQDVVGLFTEVHTGHWNSQQSGTHFFINYILTARLADGSNERLCISESKEQIEQLAASICARMSVPLLAG